MSYKEMGYDLNETSIQFYRNSKVGLNFANINVSTSLYDGSNHFISKEECEKQLDSITPHNEYNKIWNKFDYQALKNICERITVNKKDKEFDIVIKSYKEFERLIKKLGIYEIYFKEKKLLDKKRKLLESNNLTEVKFKKYQSWETGLCFLILNEIAEKNIFDKLIKSGLYYHEIDEENEEKFTEWCIIDNEMNRLKLGENGIKVTTN